MILVDVDAYKTFTISLSKEEALALVRMIDGASLVERRLFNRSKEEIRKELS